MNRIFGGLWLMGAAFAIFIGACAATSSEVGKLDEPDAGAMPGGGGENGGVPEVCEPGDQRTAADGCNSCSCNDDGSGWSCTQIDCGPADECTAGSMRLSDDKCSVCTCENGTWDCPPTGTGCGTECDEGETRAAGDGCNSCTCFHGNWGCTMINCQPALICPSGLADCDGDPANQCETNILTSVANCGACGNYCALAGAVASCVDAKCVIDQCDVLHADCNLDPSDGCEVPTGGVACKRRCEVPADSPEIMPAADGCKCPTGTTCVRNSVPDKGDLCYPSPLGCGGGIGDCGCLGSCVCPGSSGAQCTEQMAVGGVFILDCGAPKAL